MIQKRQWVAIWIVLWILVASAAQLPNLAITYGALISTILVSTAYVCEWALDRYGIGFWYGEPLWKKYVILVLLAISLQLSVPLDPVTYRDLLAAPVNAAIWLVIGYAIWWVVIWIRGRGTWSLR